MSVNEHFEIPKREETLHMKRGSYAKLEEDGLVAPGTWVSGGDIIIGKTTPIPARGTGVQRFQKKDSSIPLRITESGIVDQVSLTTNGEGCKFTKVRVRTIRIPQIGDKFSSRHVQKGTIGMTYRQEDLPFTCEGECVGREEPSSSSSSSSHSSSSSSSSSSSPFCINIAGF